jgi:hypothetical protein
VLEYEELPVVVAAASTTTAIAAATTTASTSMSAVPVASLFAEVVVVAVATATATATAASTEAAASTTATAAAIATATAAARTTATASRTTAAATPRLPFFCDVHADSATIEALTIHLLHCGLGRIPFGERHEAKASGTPRLSVGNHLRFNDFSKRRESIA